jgi:ATP-dependent helicase/DNAse subunit B
VSEVDGIIKYLNEIINLLAVRIEKSDDAEANYKMFQLEYLYNFSTHLNRLTDAMQTDGIEMNQITFWNMLMQILNNASVVLTGEPLKGLQVMGLLETRNLDFENVFILSMNEAKMPKGASNLSYIPYSLRKAFGMPTFEDNDNITAYYFYSLIQKAKNVFLFYDTEVGNEVKEKSRYILQIENELIEKNKKIKYTSKIVSPTVRVSNEAVIEVKKDEALVEFMLKDIKRISPSDVNNYIGCSLQFYLKKVLKLEAGDEVEEVFSAGTFGTVFHGVMQELYLPYLGKNVDEKIVDGIIEVVDNNFDEVFDRFIKSSKELKYLNFKEKGRNVLYKSVIQKLVRRLLLEEKKRGDFHVSGLETWIEEKIPVKILGEERTVNIGGKVDRVDDVKGIKEVLDYKTGEAGLKKFNEKNPDEFWKELFIDTKLKANLQTLFYSYLLYLRDGGESYQAGLYPLKEIKDGIKYMRPEPFTKEELETFGKGVRKVVEEMYDPSKTFVQTEDEKHCEYCDFKSLCRR